MTERAARQIDPDTWLVAACVRLRDWRTAGAPLIADLEARAKDVLGWPGACPEARILATLAIQRLPVADIRAAIDALFDAWDARPDPAPEPALDRRMRAARKARAWLRRKDCGEPERFGPDGLQPEAEL